MTEEPPRPAFPFRPRDPFAPPEEFAELRRTCPVAEVSLPTGDRAWLVTSYAGNRQVLGDQRLSRAATTRPEAPRMGPARPEAASMLAMDPPGHTRLRRLVAAAFTTARAEALRPRLQQIVDGLLDDMVKAGRPADVVFHLAQPLPITVICELLGVPVADRESFYHWTNTSLSVDVTATAEVAAARGELKQYMEQLVEQARADPGDDLLGVLSQVEEDGDRLKPGELTVLAGTLLTAGYHTVRATLTNAIAVLLIHPDQWELLCTRPDLSARAVEELLRYTPGPVSGGTIRVATEDLEIDGVPICAGQAVLPSTISANRDATVFTDPDRLDLTRTDNPHIAFGHGIHRCVGAAIGRVQLRVALDTLAARFPTLRLAVPPEELEFGLGTMIRGFNALPVTW